MLGGKNMIMCRSDRSISSSCTSNSFYFAAYYFWQIGSISGLIFFAFFLQNRNWSMILTAEGAFDPQLWKVTLYAELWHMKPCGAVCEFWIQLLNISFIHLDQTIHSKTWVSMATVISIKLCVIEIQAMEKSCILLFGKLFVIKRTNLENKNMIHYHLF